MDYGEFTVLGDCHTYHARHRLIRGEGSGRYLRPIDGDWSILWTAGWDYREGDLSVIPKNFLDIFSVHQ